MSSWDDPGYDPTYQRIQRLEADLEAHRLLIRRIVAACSMATAAGTIQELAVIIDEISTWVVEVDQV